RQLELPPGGKPGFTQLPPAVTGIAFTNVLSQARHMTNQIYLNGSGEAACQVRGSNRPIVEGGHRGSAVDILPCNASPRHVANRVQAVIGNVQSERPIPINIRQRE